jgi:Ca2+/Na+ antiporter
MKTSVQLLVSAIALLGYVVAPVTLIWGWLCWISTPKLQTIPAFLSLIGFILANASALTAFISITYALSIHGFAFYDPRLMRIVGWGILCSLVGFVFGICGLWRPNSLRWHVPVCAIGTLAFWFGVAISQ